MLTGWMEAVDYWIQFTARVARFPAPWVALHRLLSVPLLVRLRRETVSLSSGERVSCRVRSVKLAWLLGETQPAPSAGTPDVSVVQVHPWAVARWRRRGWLMVPTFVRLRASVEDVPPARMSKSLRANITRARREDLRTRRGDHADRDAAIAMVVTWARERFGEDVWLPPPHSWRRMLRRSRLLFVGDESRDIAVAIVVRARGGREAWLTSLGLADGDADLLRTGALTAAYSAVADDARSSGAAILDAGRCWARSDDGIAAHKLRWGLRPTVDPMSPVYAIRAHTPAGADFLAAQPLWSLGPGDALVGG